MGTNNQEKETRTEKIIIGYILPGIFIGVLLGIGALLIYSVWQ